jgi:hypothetical protein
MAGKVEATGTALAPRDLNPTGVLNTMEYSDVEGTCLLALLPKTS